MSASDHPVSCNSPPSNGQKNHDNVIMSNETDTIAVVSPQNITMHINGAIQNENASITQPKSVLKNEIISDDPSKHLSVGHDVMLTFLKIVDAKGYENCMGHGNKAKFIKKINDQLHAEDGPLSRFKKTNDDTFLKKITRATKVLDRHLDVSHSSGPGENGEEYPQHLKQLLIYYHKIMKASSNNLIKEKTQSERNLVIQNEVLKNSVPPAHSLGNKQRHSSRTKNQKEGHDIVKRGDNTHHASNCDILTIEDKPVFKKKSTPNTSALIQDANNTKRDFSTIFEDMNKNQMKKEERLSKENNIKLEYYRHRDETKRLAQQQKWILLVNVLNKKNKETRITNLTRLISLVKDEVVAYKEMPELQVAATKRLSKYYDEFEKLNA